jgi:hypothetical protein
MSQPLVPESELKEFNCAAHNHQIDATKAYLNPAGEFLRRAEVRRK